MTFNLASLDFLLLEVMVGGEGALKAEKINIYDVWLGVKAPNLRQMHFFRLQRKLPPAYAIRYFFTCKENVTGKIHILRIPQTFIPRWRSRSNEYELNTDDPSCQGTGYRPTRPFSYLIYFYQGTGIKSTVHKYHGRFSLW